MAEEQGDRLQELRAEQFDGACGSQRCYDLMRWAIDEIIDLREELERRLDA
jgi:hypothetical protein